ncbi:class I SAM-dependent methyltransferase [Micromonospora sp. CPCC 205371]|nr:class I SAM-dependent methyltransferase [Micromonospora sp. CPCC 205371]
MKRTTQPARNAADRTDRWLRGWESMMDAYLPGRGDMMMVALQAVEAALGRPPSTVLDVGGGPGTTARALLRRWPGSRVTVLDLDPVLLHLATRGAPGAVVRPADLGTARWCLDAGGPYELALAVMTLHYFPEGRVRQLYAQIRRLLRPGGVLLVADAMPQPSPRVRPERPNGQDLWGQWWRALASDPAMAALLEQRARTLAGRSSAEFAASVEWHRAAASDAGYAESRLVWRRGDHALLAARNT